MRSAICAQAAYFMHSTRPSVTWLNTLVDGDWLPATDICACKCISDVSSGVTTRGPVRQLPQGAWRRGAPWADEWYFFCFATEFQKTEISNKSKLNDNDVLSTRIRRVWKIWEYVPCTDYTGQGYDIELIPTVKWKPEIP